MDDTTTNHAENFMAKASRSFETKKPKIRLGIPTPGVSFTYDEPRTVPAGEYLVMEPDTRDNRRMVLLNTATYRMYTIEKRLLSQAEV